METSHKRYVKAGPGQEINLAQQIKQKKKTRNYHRPGCLLVVKTPADHERSEYFVRRGQSPAGAVRWQCKECGKITNVPAEKPNILSYNQRINGIMQPLLEAVLAGVGVTETCDQLNISPKTYYHKLALLSLHLKQMKREKEAKYYKRHPVNQLALSTVIRLYGKKHQVAGLVASYDRNTGYLYRAYYQEATESLRIFMEDTLVEHFEDICALTRPKKLLISHTEYWDKPIKEALDLIGIAYTWKAPTDKEGSMLKNLKDRIGYSGERYIKDYLDIYGYAHNFLPHPGDTGKINRAPFTMPGIDQILKEE